MKSLDIFTLRNQIPEDTGAVILYGRDLSDTWPVEFVSWAHTDDPNSVRVLLIQPRHMIKNNVLTPDGAYFLITYKPRD